MASLRALFNLAHRLNDALGSSWVYVIDVLNCLEKVLTSPYTSAEQHTVKSGRGEGGGLGIGRRCSLHSYTMAEQHTVSRRCL